MSKQNYKLHYFPVRGRGDFIRYILEYANVPYEEVFIDFADWPKMKPKMPMGVIPVLELANGQKLSQSLAIGRYLATLNGLVSDDAFENAWGDQLVLAIEDIYFQYYRPYVVATLVDKDESKQKEAWETLKTKAIIPLFEQFEKFLGDKTWFCGNKIHWADLVIAELVDRIEKIFQKGFTAPKYSKLYAHMKRVHELPNIKKYADVRPDYVL